MQTNEQSILEVEKQLGKLKEEYISVLKPVALKVANSSATPTLEELLACQTSGNKYFNFAENFVGNSDLLGAHKSGKWVTGFAESCHSVLEAYIQHMSFLRSYESVYSGAFQEPSIHAFANMQRMVKLYLPRSTWESLKTQFVQNNLPIKGFQYSGANDVKSTPTWQLVAALIIGCLFLLLFVFLAVYIPKPEPFQQLIFRGGFAVSLAAIASIIPGFLSVSSKLNSFSVKAGGAIAIFVIVWFINPPALIAG